MRQVSEMAITQAQYNRYRKMKMSKFLEMMDKAHPEWKVKTTMISKKKDYALQQAKSNTSYLRVSDFTNVRLGEGNKAGKNKGKINVGKLGASRTNYYIPDNKKSLDAHAKKHKEAKYKWLLSRGNLKGLTTYDWLNWAGMFNKFQYGYGSGDSISTTGIKGYDKGTVWGLRNALIQAHHGLPLNEKYSKWDKNTYRKELNAWGLNKVKSVPQEKAPAKKKTTKRKTPAKKKAVKKVARKKTVTKKKTATKKKTIYRGKRKSPSTSATSVNVGKTMRGGDGKMYVCKSYKRGNKRVKRWVKA
jgi:hypothetical protein